MRTVILYIAFLFASISLFAQQGKTTLSQNSILVGEKITLTYTITFPKNKTFKFTPENSVIPSYRKARNGILTNSTSNDIEILTPFHDSLYTKNSEKVWIGRYEITAWDSGTYVLANANIIIDDSTYQFPQVELSCGLVKAIKDQDIYDIRENFAEIPEEPLSVKIKTFAKNNWWWLALIGAAILGLFIYFRLKKVNRVIPKIRELPLKERTLLAIDALEKARLWEKGQLKEHFIELSFILRSYLSSRYSINLLEKTTHETKLLLQHKGLHEETIRVIISILSESDMVKFAKSQPEEIAVLKISQLARQVIAETSPIEFENAE